MKFFFWDVKYFKVNNYIPKIYNLETMGNHYVLKILSNNNLMFDKCLIALSYCITLMLFVVIFKNLSGLFN